METLLNYGMAWISTLCLLITAMEFIFNRIFKKNLFFKGIHKILGIFLILTAIIHGLFSSESIFSFNWGTALLIIAIVLAFTYPCRKLLSRIKWLPVHRLLTLLLLIILPIHIISVGGIQIFNQIESQQNQTIVDNGINTSDQEQLTGAIQTYTLGTNLVLKEGTYKGSGTGFGPNLTVEVTIKNNQITNIEIISHNERNERYYGRPMTIIPQEIIDSQSLSVDTVTGATKTSKGIINATKDALKNAIISGTLN